MAKYYYNKYTVAYGYSIVTISTNKRVNYDANSSTGAVYSGNYIYYGANAVADGHIVGVSPIANPTVSNVIGYYSIIGAPPAYTDYVRITRFVEYYNGGSTAHFVGDLLGTQLKSTSGSIVQSNIVAENGTYPTNGQHTDGYWYIRGSLVIPTTPSYINVPVNLQYGVPVTVTWGTSTNQEGYKLERSINGGAYAEIYSGVNSSYTNTPLSTWSTVSYRVRAYNGTSYSAYVTSPNRPLLSFPELKIKIDGVLRTSEKGWTKIDGAMREIDKIWVKINGVLKEV